MVIEGIRSFFASKMVRSEGEKGPDPVAVAACALLLEVAQADTVFRNEERERVIRHIREDFGLPQEDVGELLRLAEEERRQSADLYQFTRLIAENFSRERRLRLVEAIWGVVYSDGSLSTVESHLARKIAELLGFQHPDVQAVKERVAKRSE